MSASESETDDETKQFVGAANRRDRAKPEPHASWRFYIIVTALTVLSPVLIALALVWFVLGLLFTTSPYLMTIVGFMGVTITYILSGFLVTNVSPDAYFATDLAFGFDTALIDSLIVTILVLFVLVWSTVLTAETRKFCVVPTALAGLVFLVAKISARKDWAYARTGAVLFYATAVTAIASLVVGLLNLWVPASEEELAEAEDDFLCIQYAKHDPERVGNGSARYRRYKVAGLSTIEAPNTQAAAAKPSDLPPLVLVHGYASGSALWTLNVDALSKHFQVYAIDWLGCGLSDRPAFTARTAEEAEEFFVAAIEQWRAEMKIEKMVLVAHSMGGIISTAYALRYPFRVAHLALVSPAGVAGPPKRETSLHPVVRLIRVVWPYTTPMAVVRFLGPLGMPFLRWSLEIRSSVLPETSVIRACDGSTAVLTRYLYHNYCLPASGEKALNLLIMPGVYGRTPLAKRITSKTETSITFFYGGAGDWMDSRHALDLMVSLASKGKRDVALHTISSAGHQMFLDNPREFNDKLLYSLGVAMQEQYPALRALASSKRISGDDGDDEEKGQV